MDSINGKYNSFTMDMEKAKKLDRANFYLWFQFYYENIKTWFMRMADEERRLLSYSNLGMFRFIKALIFGIKCKEENCKEIYGFGMDDNYCDFCVDKYQCKESWLCKFKIGSGKSSACHHKNFARCEDKIKYWVYSLNEFRPEAYTPKTEKEANFFCVSCTHVTNVVIADFNRSIQCKYCSAGCSDLCDIFDCSLCTKQSFASDKNAHMWASCNKKKARDVRLYSRDEYYFYCTKCKHLFLSTPNEIAGHVHGCGFCTGKRLCGNINCGSCIPKSFYPHKKSKYWSSLNEDKPWEIYMNSEKKRIFNCRHCKSNYTTNVCVVSRGSWCKCKKNKTETKLLDWLKDNFYNPMIIYQFRDCINPYTKKSLPMDFKIGKVNVELDGKQHTFQVSNWEHPDKLRMRDVYKMLYYFKRGISTIRIVQLGVWKDKFNWRKILKEQIIRLNNSSYPEIVYIENDELTIIDYQKHKADFEYHLTRNTSDKEWYDIFEKCKTVSKYNKLSIETDKTATCNVVLNN